MRDPSDKVELLCLVLILNNYIYLFLLDSTQFEHFLILILT